MDKDKLDLKSPDLVNENFEKLGTLFPNCVTEGAEGKTIDFDLLKQELNHAVVEGNKERYRLEWPGKREAVVTTNLPTTKTLRPIGKDSVDFDNSENLYIEGDNLEVLKLLQESYLGKIKLIYIDPPYNTGNDIIYKNDYFSNESEYLEKSGQKLEGLISVSNVESNGKFHSDWLSMMYPVIKLSRNLLKQDGFFAVSIDHNEINTLNTICDEIFGRENRIGLVSVVHKPEGRNQAKFFGPSNEFMLVYAKDSKKCSLRKVVLDNNLKENFNLSDLKGLYKRKNFIRLSDGHYSLRKNKPSFWYPIYKDKNNNLSILKKSENDIAIYPITRTGQERTWKTTKETFIERYNNGDIEVIKEEGNWIIYEKLRENQVIKTHWIDKRYHGFHFGTKIVDNLLGFKSFDFPKSIHLMNDIIKLFTEEDDIIVDFFSGSGTTGHAVLNVNSEDNYQRKFILVQIPAQINDNKKALSLGYKSICDLGKERIRRAAKKIKEETGADIDYGFRVYRLDSSNMQDVYYKPQDYTQENIDLFTDNVKPDRSADDLLAQVMLDWGLPLSLRINQVDVLGKKVFKVAENSLYACFDSGIDEEFAKAIAKDEPLRIVFKDSGFKNDTAKTNVKQLLKQLSPETEMKVI